jgi:hypothetical protein
MITSKFLLHIKHKKLQDKPRQEIVKLVNYIDLMYLHGTVRV